MPKKAGRPKKLGVIREPNGKPSRSDRVLHIQRKLDAIQKLGMQAEMGTPLGQLLTWERITKQQYDAGQWFSEARKAADGAFSLPARECAAQDMNRLGGAYHGDDDEETVRRKRNIAATYARAEEALGIGSKRFKAVMWVCVHERRCDDYAMMLALVDGLDAIVAHRNVRRAA